MSGFTRFALYDRTSREYAVRSGRTGVVLFPDSDRVTAALVLGEAQAKALIPLLEQAHPGSSWELRGAADPCPCCGRVMDRSDLDFLYPASPTRLRWRAGCNVHDFGCGYEVFGTTPEEALLKWNQAAPFEDDVPLLLEVLPGATGTPSP